MTPKYFVMNEEPNVNILGVNRIILAFHDDKMKEFAGKNFSDFVYELEDGKMRAGALRSETMDNAQYYFERLITDEKFGNEMVKNIEQVAEEIYPLCKDVLRKLKEGSLSEDERKKIIKKIFTIFTEICIYGLIGPIIEIGGGRVTEKLNEIIGSKVKEVSKRNEYAALLSFRYVESYDQKAEKILARIAQEVYENEELRNLFNREVINEKLPLEITNKIEDYIFKWGWVNYGYQGPEYTIKNAINALKGMLELGISPEEYTKKIDEELHQNAKKQQEILAELNLSEEELYFVKIAEGIVHGKYLRAKMMALMCFTINNILKHFAKKEGLSMKQIGVCTSREILQYFDTGNFPHVDELNKRLKYCILISRPEGDNVMVGSEAREWAKKNIEVEEIDENVSEITGQVAFPSKDGVIKGVVRVINLTSEMENFREGDILVSIATTPDIVPVMKKAAAIVTNMGGLTCHAAIVSRELGIPCVIGTKIATKVFKDGDKVEVDANKGIVRKLK